jgi:hypothetical protein
MGGVEKRSRWVAMPLVVLPPIAVPILVLWVELEKKSE